MSLRPYKISGTGNFGKEGKEGVSKPLSVFFISPTSEWSMQEAHVHAHAHGNATDLIRMIPTLVQCALNKKLF